MGRTTLTLLLLFPAAVGPRVITGRRDLDGCEHTDTVYVAWSSGEKEEVLVCVCVGEGDTYSNS